AMGLISWLTEPIREVHRLAPTEVEAGRFSMSRRPAAEIDESTFETLEQQRLAALRHRTRSFIVGVPVVILLSAITYGLCAQFGVDSGDTIIWSIVALVFGGLIVRFAANAGIWIFRKTAKHRVLSVLAAQQGLQYQMEGVEDEILQPFKDQDLFGLDTNSGDSEDVFSGKIEGVDFVLFEARRLKVTKSDNSTSKTLAFHGLCLRLSFPKRFSGTTRVLSDFGLLNKLHEVGNDVKLERVRLEDRTFEKHFEVVSSDQVEARYLLTPALMERLMEAQRILGKRTRLRAGFHDRYMLLTLDTRKNRSFGSRVRGGPLNELHHFEIENPNKPVEQSAVVRRFEQEIAVCKDIVKTLELNMKTRI
ncbi:MAG: DUF3137 domain-containing protein, partial [Acidobacteriota bacterium]